MRGRGAHTDFFVILTVFLTFFAFSKTSCFTVVFEAVLNGPKRRKNAVKSVPMCIFSCRNARRFAEISIFTYKTKAKRTV